MASPRSTAATAGRRLDRCVTLALRRLPRSSRRRSVAGGGDGVTCNIVLPGRIATPRIGFLDEQKAKRAGRSAEAVAKESHAAIPVGRYGDPQEYADVVAFVASARASYVNGSVIRVDGGFIPSI